MHWAKSNSELARFIFQSVPWPFFKIFEEIILYRDVAYHSRCKMSHVNVQVYVNDDYECLDYTLSCICIYQRYYVCVYTYTRSLSVGSTMKV